MTEALRTAPEPFIGIIPRSPRPNHAEIPTRLIKASDKLGIERGSFIEERVQSIISTQNNIVENVIRNEYFSAEDLQGHDLTVILNGDSPLKVVYVQVKSSRDGVVEYKKRIRDKFFSNQEDKPELVKKWLTEHGIIILNGSETKTDEEILESFYPQLERIQHLVRDRQDLKQIDGKFSLRFNSLIQIFPEAI